MHRSTLITTLAVTVAVAIAGCSSETKTEDAKSISLESEAKNTINSVLFDQKQYFLENQTFTVAVDQLEGAGAILRSPNYTYTLKAKPNTQKGVAISASPRKPDLRSFTGVVFVVGGAKTKVTVSQICETETPSKTPPAMPAVPQKPTDALPCPTGSRSTLDLVAQQ